jgi:hypothetical protein
MWLLSDKKRAVCYIILLPEETSMFVQVKKVFVGCITLARYTFTLPYTFMLCTGTTFNFTINYKVLVM